MKVIFWFEGQIIYLMFDIQKFCFELKKKIKMKFDFDVIFDIEVNK